MYHGYKLLRGPYTLESEGVHHHDVIWVAKVRVVTLRCLDTWMDYIFDVFPWTTAGALTDLICTYVRGPAEEIVVLCGRERLGPSDHLPFAAGKDDTLLHFFTKKYQIEISALIEI